MKKYFLLSCILLITLGSQAKVPPFKYIHSRGIKKAKLPLVLRPNSPMRLLALQNGMMRAVCVQQASQERSKAELEQMYHKLHALLRDKPAREYTSQDLVRRFQRSTIEKWILSYDSPVSHKEVKQWINEFLESGNPQDEIVAKTWQWIIGELNELPGMETPSPLPTE